MVDAWLRAIVEPHDDEWMEVWGDVYNHETGDVDMNQRYHINDNGDRREKRYRI